MEKDQQFIIKAEQEIHRTDSEDLYQTSYASGIGGSRDYYTKTQPGIGSQYMGYRDGNLKQMERDKEGRFKSNHPQ